MPKEQPCLSELGPCATSSKNAKNKSNRMTLLAIRDTTKHADDSSGKDSRCSSEKDSGYSDGSDWQQTDVEDHLTNKRQSRGSGHAETSNPGQTIDLGQGNPAGHKLPPIYVINNMVIKQPDMIQKRAQLPLRNGSRETGSSGGAHMILLQQPRLLPASVQLHKPLSRKSSITGKKMNGSYLPILNSYPRIAPHPSKKPPDKSSLNGESQNLSKRICTEHNNPVTGSQPELHLYKQPQLAVVTSGMPCSSSTRDSRPTTVSSSRSSLCTTSSILSTRGLHRNSTTSTRHHRFLNTVKILRQSGLLDITLRTKELMRQSSATEQSIAQLRRHTELLCQAASNPGCSLSAIAAWEYLHRAMAESNSYPNLKILQNLQIPSRPDSASQPASVYTGDANGPLAADESSGVPPSRLLTTIPDLNGDKSSEIMPPDSSTG